MYISDRKIMTILTLLPKILVVDDDELFRRILVLNLESWGYPVASAESREDVATVLDDTIDIVMIDKNLAGPGGPESGLDELEAILRRLPFVPVVLMTGYASESSIERAFAGGADDYWSKDANFFALARQRLKQLTELWKQAPSRRTTAAREARIRDGWGAVKSEKSKSKRGKYLEELMKDLFASVAGFESIHSRAKTRYEEIDLVIRNESVDPFWQKESPYWLAECKNWTDRVGKNELIVFYDKLASRFERATLGFLIAPNGFASTVSTGITAERKGANLVILMAADEIDEMIAAPDRNQWLKSLHQKSVLAAV